MPAPIALRSLLAVGALLATLALVSCTLLKPLPTAQALLAEIAVTSLSPVGSAVFAVFTIDQAVPL